ncbi:MAG TPA: hydroxylamine reductase, partial [bacterium]|nr:hydroxylamine reductase [bacterium]
DHAWILGHKDEEVNSFFYKGLSAIADEDISSEDLVGMVLECGKVNLKCMEMLDRGHTNRFGNPVPTKVFLGTKKGPAIVVSGHDLFDLEQLLEQTEDTGINIYTHGEMLPAHGYPELKKYRHLVGHYGTAWQNQQREFDSFPGPILMTTNCIQKPRPSYIERIFTTGLVGWPGVKHIAGTNSSKDFTPIIEAAKKVGGFPEDKPGKEITVGFAHNAVLSIADRIVDAVKKGHIKRIFLVGGCDGAKPGRNYYTQFAQTIPDDCLILTLACGKFRFNNLDFGEINSIPRLIDCGQCNDAYSAIIIAKALADAFGCSVNELPLSLILSWYEQKAVCILLTLFSLGIKNIRLGPTLPAFLSENVLKILIENFNVKPITTVEADLKEILGN